MKIRSQYFLIFLITIISCTTQPDWNTYTDEKGSFKIEFKGKPLTKTEEQYFQFGDITWTAAFIDKPDAYNLSYSIKYADFPPEVITSDSIRLLQEFFVFIQQDFFKKLGQESVSTIKIIKIQNYPGREFIWQDKKTKINYTRKMFLVKNRVYLLEVKYATENAFNRDIDGFCDKFYLLNAVDNPNPEIIAEKPLKKFEAMFPGETTTNDNPQFHEFLGNVHSIMEGYAVPQADSPANMNIMYAVNYAKIPDDKLKIITTEELKEFARKAIIDNILSHSQGKIIYQKEISLDGNWGTEGQGVILDGKVVIHTRSYIVQDYYYQVMVMSKIGTENNKEAIDFLNSFKLKRE